MNTPNKKVMAELYDKLSSEFYDYHAKRGDIEVEPLKSEVVVKGDGPYRYIG